MFLQNARYEGRAHNVGDYTQPIPALPESLQRFLQPLTFDDVLAVSVEHVAELLAQSRKFFCRNVKVLQEELLPDHIRRQLDQFLFGIGLVCFGACIDVLQKLLRRFCCVNMIHMKEAPQSADIIAVTLRGSVLCMYGSSNIEENSLYHNNSSLFPFFFTPAFSFASRFTQTFSFPDSTVPLSPGYVNKKSHSPIKVL